MTDMDPIEIMTRASCWEAERVGRSELNVGHCGCESRCEADSVSSNDAGEMRAIIKALDAAGFAIVPKELPTSAFSADALANGVAEQYRTLVNFVRTIP